ncbi:MAG: hypothetical protein RL685_1001 [Pseudomonadota bacterium]|jgi:hypothetical protein
MTKQRTAAEVEIVQLLADSGINVLHGSDVPSF